MVVVIYVGRSVNQMVGEMQKNLEMDLLYYVLAIGLGNLLIIPRVLANNFQRFQTSKIVV